MVLCFYCYLGCLIGCFFCICFVFWWWGFDVGGVVDVDFCFGGGSGGIDVCCVGYYFRCGVSMFDFGCGIV